MTAVLAKNAEDSALVPHAMGDKWMVAGTITLSGTYKTGGDATLVAEVEKVLGQLGINKIDYLDVQGNTGGYSLQWDYVNNKLLVYRTGAAVKGALEQLPEEAYPAALTSASLRLFCLGS